jgi:HEAT repeat protein
MSLARQAKPLSVRQLTPDLELQAYRVALVADLLHVSTARPDSGWVLDEDVPPRLWNQHADYMRQSAVELAEAIETKNATKVGLKVGRLAFTCNACHERYWGGERPLRNSDPPYTEPELLVTLQRGSNGRRREALAEAAGMQVLGRPLVRVLIERMRQDPDATVRSGAVTALQRHAFANPTVARALVDALHDQSPEVSGAALAALRQHGRVSLDGLNRISGMLQGVPEPMRWWLAVRLEPTADPSARLPEVLRDAGLKDADAAVRLAAVTILGRLGPKAKDAAAALAAVLQDPEMEVREAAALALRQMPAAGAIPGLVRSLYDPDPVVRGRAGIALSRAGKAALPALICVLKGDNADARATACSALGRIGPDADEAVPALLALFKGPDVYQSKLAALALKKIDPKAVPTSRP